MIDLTDPVAVRAEAERRTKLRASGARTFDDPGPVFPEKSGHDERLEKQIEHEGDVLMQKRGFEVIRFSHPGKTQQTPGIPDRRYYRRPRSDSPALVVWVEYKSAHGRQRPGQRLFQELAEACGESYVLGGIEKLTDWLRSNLP